MLRFFKIENGLIREIDGPPEDQARLLAEANWIDAQEPDEQERALLQDMLHTDLPEATDVDEIEASARSFVDQAGVHVHAMFLSYSEGRHNTRGQYSAK